MAKSMSVKVPVKKVLVALEATLKRYKAHQAEVNKNKEAYDKAYDAWKEKYNEWSRNPKPLKLPKGAVQTSIKWDQIYNRSTDGYDYVFVLRYAAPEGWTPDEGPSCPVKNYIKTPEGIPDYDLTGHIAEIEGMIRLLKMTDEETVNATTMKAVAQYL